MTALAAERKFFDRLTGRRPGASMIGRPSAVVRSHCTRFCPAATNRFAAITAFAALRKWRPALETSPPPLWPPPPPKIFISAAPAPGGGGSCGVPRSNGGLPAGLSGPCLDPLAAGKGPVRAHAFQDAPVRVGARETAPRRGLRSIPIPIPIPDPPDRTSAEEDVLVAPSRRRGSTLRDGFFVGVLGRRLAAARSARSARVHRVGPPDRRPLRPDPERGPRGGAVRGRAYRRRIRPGDAARDERRRAVRRPGVRSVRSRKSRPKRPGPRDRAETRPGRGARRRNHARVPRGLLLLLGRAPRRRAPRPRRLAAEAVVEPPRAPDRRVGGGPVPRDASAPPGDPLAPARLAPPPGVSQGVPPADATGVDPGGPSFARRDRRMSRARDCSSSSAPPPPPPKRCLALAARIAASDRTRRRSSSASRRRAPRPPRRSPSRCTTKTRPRRTPRRARRRRRRRAGGTPPSDEYAACAEYSDDAEYSRRVGIISGGIRPPGGRRGDRRIGSHRRFLLHARREPPRALLRQGPVLPGERVVRARDRGGGDVPRAERSRRRQRRLRRLRAPRAHRAVLPRDHEQLRKAPRARTGRAPSRPGRRRRSCPGRASTSPRRDTPRRSRPPRRGADYEAEAKEDLVRDTARNGRRHPPLGRREGEGGAEAVP